MRTLRSSTCDTCGRRLILLCISVSMIPFSLSRAWMRSHLVIPNRLHPSRFVVFNRSSMWKNCNGVLDPSAGIPVGSFSIVFSTVHGPSTLITGVNPRSGNAMSYDIVLYKLCILQLTGNVRLPIRSLLWLRTHDCNLTLA